MRLLALRSLTYEFRRESMQVERECKMALQQSAILALFTDFLRRPCPRTRPARSGLRLWHPVRVLLLIALCVVCVCCHFHKELKPRSLDRLTATPCRARETPPARPPRRFPGIFFFLEPSMPAMGQQLSSGVWAQRRLVGRRVRRSAVASAAAGAAPSAASAATGRPRMRAR